MVTLRPTIGNRRGDMGASRHRRSARGRTSPPAVTRGTPSPSGQRHGQMTSKGRPRPTGLKPTPHQGRRTRGTHSLEGPLLPAQVAALAEETPPPYSTHRYSDSDGDFGGRRDLHRCSSTRDRQAGATTRALMTHDDWSDPDMATRCQRTDEDFEREMTQEWPSVKRRPRGGEEGVSPHGGTCFFNA